MLIYSIYEALLLLKRFVEQKKQKGVQWFIKKKSCHFTEIRDLSPESMSKIAGITIKSVIIICVYQTASTDLKDFNVIMNATFDKI